MIAVAAGGKQAAELAAELGDGLFATEPRADLVETFTGAGGSRPAVRRGADGLGDRPRKAGVEEALQTTRWALTGWKVMSELPNPVNFEAARDRPGRGHPRAVRRRPGRRRRTWTRSGVRRGRLRPHRAAERRPGPGRLHRLLRQGTEDR